MYNTVTVMGKADIFLSQKCVKIEHVFNSFLVKAGDSLLLKYVNTVLKLVHLL